MPASCHAEVSNGQGQLAPLSGSGLCCKLRGPPLRPMYTSSLEYVCGNHKTLSCRMALFQSLGPCLVLLVLRRLTFSSMTCLSVASATTSASFRVRSFLKASSSAVCAPSLPLPMALALYLK